MKDMFGNELKTGDYFVYSALCNKRVGLRVGRLTAEGERNKVASFGWHWVPEGKSYSGWGLMQQSRPGAASLARVDPSDLPKELIDILA